MAEFEGKKLKYLGRELIFMHDILEILETSRGCLVLLKWKIEGPWRNIFMVSPEGHIEWQIQNIEGVTDENASAYGGLIMKDGAVRVYNTSGLNCHLDLETGAVTDCILVK